MAYFFSYYALNVSDSIALYIYIIYIYIYIKTDFDSYKQQVSIHTLAVIGRDCLAGGAGGWCPSTIVLHIFWVTKY